MFKLMDFEFSKWNKIESETVPINEILKKYF